MGVEVVELPTPFADLRACHPVKRVPLGTIRIFDTVNATDRIFGIARVNCLTNSEAVVDRTIIMSTRTPLLPNPQRDQNWDAFVASLHRVWEYAPDFCPPVRRTCLDGVS